MKRYTEIAEAKHEIKEAVAAALAETGQASDKLADYMAEHETKRFVVPRRDKDANSFYTVEHDTDRVMTEIQYAMMMDKKVEALVNEIFG